METKQMIKYKENFWTKLKKKISTLFTRKKDIVKQEEKTNKVNELEKINEKQDIMELYQKVKNKEILLEDIDSNKLYKVMILLNEEAKMLNQKMEKQCFEIKSHLNTAIMYNKQAELAEQKTIFEEGVQITKNEDKREFKESVKFEEDPDKAVLLKLQDEIEKTGINKENVYNLTKDLTEEQKEKLKELYQTQIKEYEISIENSKRKILNIKRKL